MKEQKNIERLFQEKFKDFEVAPPEMVWKNIESKLNEKKKKRRVIPFWFKASGIAASFLLGFYTYTFFNKSSNIDVKNDSNTIVIDDKNNSSKTENDNNNIEEKQNINNIIIKENNTLSGVENKNNDSRYTKQNQKTILKNKIQNNYFTNTEDNFQKSSEKDFINQSKSNEINQEKIYSGKSNLVNSDKIKVEDINSNFIKNKIDFEKINNISKNKNSPIVVDKTPINTTQDSSLVAKISEEIKALEQLLKEKEVGKNAEEKEKRDKWGVSTSAAPVYFNSTTNGSPINTQLSENSKSYVSTVSYGLGINYSITEKLSLRSGINNLKLEYNTNNVEYTTTLKGVPDDGSMLNRNSNGQNIVLGNKNDTSLSSDVENFNQTNFGELNQATSYYEVPLELSYKLIDKKFGVEVIAGMSSLFLNKNTVSLLSNGMEMEIGQANNLNKIHFSSNIGLGIKYSFLKSFNLNFNPMFKYQLNTYSDNSGNFKPYFIGLYSGISYKF